MKKTSFIFLGLLFVHFSTFSAPMIVKGRILKMVQDEEGIKILTVKEDKTKKKSGALYLENTHPDFGQLRSSLNTAKELDSKVVFYVDEKDLRTIENVKVGQ